MLCVIVSPVQRVAAVNTNTFRLNKVITKLTHAAVQGEQFECTVDSLIVRPRFFKLS